MRSCVLTTVIVGLFVAAGTGQETKPTPEVRTTLAPTGTLRVGLYVGNPSSLVRQPVAGQATGIGFELGRELARWLDVPFDRCFIRTRRVPKAASIKVECVPMLRRRDRKRSSSPSLGIGAGYLVPRGRRWRRLVDVDKAASALGNEGTHLHSLPQLLKDFGGPGPNPSALSRCFAGRSRCVATNKSIVRTVDAYPQGWTALGMTSFSGNSKGRTLAVTMLAFVPLCCEPSREERRRRPIPWWSISIQSRPAA